MEILIEEVHQYFSIAVVICCFIIGYVIKNYTKIPNKYIPIIMLVSGIIVNIMCVLNSGADIQIITFISGAVSGLASSGSYELIATSLGLKKSK